MALNIFVGTTYQLSIALYAQSLLKKNKNLSVITPFLSMLQWVST